MRNLVVWSLLTLGGASAWSQEKALDLSALSWRNIGPARGGRSIAVAGSSSRPYEYYFGATGGGLWKTTDGGTSFEPVTDGQIASSSVGAVAVAPSRPDTVYLGMGEAQLRGNVMQGDGVYKSLDAGRSWTHIGLTDSQIVSRIRVDPRDPDRLFVAALGHPSGPNEQRGVFRSVNGGRDWERVLFRGAHVGAVDLVIDPGNPDVLFASMWQVYRNAYQLWSGGEESGLWKSTDGGTTWNDLSAHPGFPDGLLGKIGIDVSPVDSNRVYAVVEAEAGGLYRSDDSGSTWKLVNASRDLWQRSFYFNRVVADPASRDSVYVLNFLLFKSEDGGASVHSVRTPHADHHDLWIDPEDPNRMICANDGGGTVSVNGGESWTEQRYPTAQMYHVTTTADVPYHVAGAQQDNTTVAVPSHADTWTGNPRRASSEAFYAVGGGENAYIAAHPSNPDLFFAGATNTLTRYDRATGEARDVQPFPRMFMGESSADVPERWNWVYPIVMTRSEPHTLYAASQHLWKSTDEGSTWEKLSPDLTRADAETMGPSGGPIVLDQDGPEIYATIFAVAPSELAPYVIWTGSDDGLVHVTKNGGREWKDVTPNDMVPNTRVSIIDASRHAPGTAYVAAKRNQMDDRAPYLWKTDDFGESWARIDRGLPAGDFVHVVREDPKRAGLLYVGTEHGIHLSQDSGSSWRSLSLNLPDVQVSDLVVEERDLVMATHGRGFYVLDDIAPLRQLEDVGSSSAFHLFRPSPGVRRLYPAHFDFLIDSSLDATVEVLDREGVVVRKLAVSTVNEGLNRISWDLRYEGATVFPGMVLESPSPTRGPWAPPGEYRVRVRAGSEERLESFRVVKDPRHPELTDRELQAQYELAAKLRDRVSEANEAVLEIRALRARLTARSDAASLLTALADVEASLYQVKNESPKDKIAFPIRLNDRLSGLLWNVQRADGAPSRAHLEVYRELSSELFGHLETFEALREQAAGFE